MPHNENHKPIHPRCGKPVPGNNLHWTPALIKRHEAGCSQCQARIGTSAKIRKRLKNYWNELEVPFEADE